MIFKNIMVFHYTELNTLFDDSQQQILTKSKNKIFKV